MFLYKFGLYRSFYPCYNLFIGTHGCTLENIIEKREIAMIRIAICDDDVMHRQLIRHLLDQYLYTHHTTADIHEFASGQALLNALYNHTFNLYLLDIVMPDMDGIELGVRLRQSGKAGIIVYLTSSPDFALEGYTAKASAYLLKPIQKEALFKILDSAFSYLIPRQDAVIMVKNADGLIRLHINQLLYVEQLSRIPHYHLTDGSVVAGSTIRCSFHEAMRGLLEDSRFYLCGASILLNLQQIKAIIKPYVVFSDGQRVLIPRRSIGALHEAWTEYWLGGNANDFK
jgi:DNA-binding LytR/AlgR family response regulator